MATCELPLTSVSTFASGNTSRMSETALSRSWSPPSQLYPYSTVNEGMLDVEACA